VQSCFSRYDAGDAVARTIEEASDGQRRAVKVSREILAVGSSELQPEFDIPQENRDKGKKTPTEVRAGKTSEESRQGSSAFAIKLRGESLLILNPNLT
jgi:hypothetical protein